MKIETIATMLRAVSTLTSDLKLRALEPCDKADALADDDAVEPDAAPDEADA